MTNIEPFILAAGGVAVLLGAYLLRDSGISSAVFGGVAALLFLGAYDSWRERWR